MRTSILTLLVLASVAAAYPQSGAVERADSLERELLKSARLPGLAVAVYRGDSLVWSRGFGVANVESARPVGTSTRFRIGSLTKLITATAAARLAQDGLLDLDVPVQKYVPSFPKKGVPISTRLLLGHLSGIRQYGRNEYINTRRYATLEEALTIFANDTLLFAPGSKYSYSSYGYVLAAAVIGTASGRGYFPFLHDSLFVPLSLMSIAPDFNDTTDTTQAAPYGLDSNKTWVEGSFNDNSNRWGAGGFLSTAEDMARFGSALLKDGFLDADSRRMLFTSQKTSDGKETGVGLGWRIATDSTGHTWYHHGGESVGGRAFLLIDPAAKVVVAILANLTFARFGQKEAREFARLFSE